MTHDDIIRMARGAGFLTLLVDETVDSVVGVYPGMNDEISDRLERFAALVAAAVAPVCGECGKSAAEGWALYCVQCSEDSMVKAAVAEEREATISKIEGEICHAEINNLRLAPLFGQRHGPLAVRVDSLAAVVDAIRARGET